jgi:Tfp pilus assembly protein PilF
MDITLDSRRRRWRQSIEIGLCVLCLVAAVAFLLVWGAGCKQATESQYLSVGDEALRDGKLAEAEKNYEAAIAAAPNDPRAHIALGNLYASEQKPALAEAEREKAIELDPRNADAHSDLARFYSGQSQLPKAEEHYRAAIALDPARASYHLELGSVLAKENKLSEAEAEIRTSLGLDPRNAKAHFELANLLASESGKQDEADAEYAQAKALDPTLVPPTSAAAAAPAIKTRRASAQKLKRLNEKFLLTKSSQVYEQPDQSSRVVAHVHSRGFVHVTGIAGDWLQVRLRSGAVGFIAATAAE